MHDENGKPTGRRMPGRDDARQVAYLITRESWKAEQPDCTRPLNYSRGEWCSGAADHDLGEVADGPLSYRGQAVCVRFRPHLQDTRNVCGASKASNPHPRLT